MSFNTVYKAADDIVDLLMRQYLRLANEMKFVNNEITSKELRPMKRFKFFYLLQLLVRDLLESHLYTLNGLARELDAPVELLTDIFLKQDCNPSYSLAIGILCLHRETFPNLYESSQPPTIEGETSCKEWQGTRPINCD